MQIVHTIEEIRRVIKEARRQGKSVGLVPTMGYFHEGHASLMRQAKSDNDVVVVSIFVNPIQFGPSEDLDRYPRDLDRDAHIADQAGVDLIFNPLVAEMYPSDYNTYVDVERITEPLCGASRPGHFRGVATVVLKLFNIVMPDRAYFGCKDFQQLKVIQRMVADLDVPVSIVPMPIVREPDGLAMSSRNAYLSAEERSAALVLHRALDMAQSIIGQSDMSPERMAVRVREFIGKEPTAQIEYAEIVDAETLVPAESFDRDTLLALAVRIGKTRLIDNTLLKR